MVQIIAGINPKILKWARESAGQTVMDVAAAFQKRPEVIEEWESGKAAPTYVQLEKLAYQLYKRPLALFFFPEVPSDPEPLRSFRTLPREELDAFSPDTRLALRQATAMQLALYELNEGPNPSPRNIFRTLRISAQTPVTQAGSRVRDYLSVPVNTQVRWHGASEALKNWRTQLQECGVFVFKRPLAQADISGFALLDDEYPVIYLNNSSPQTRQVFSLFHELGHVLLGANGVTKQDQSYIARLDPKNKGIEEFCNRFAAEILVPSEDFSAYHEGDFYNDSYVKQLADRYSVSREVILRRALDRHLVAAEYYETKAKEWAQRAEHARQMKKGGNYYLNQVTYLGSKFLQLAFGRYYQGRCTREELADYLNVKAKSVAGLEPYAVGHEGG